MSHRKHKLTKKTKKLFMMVELRLVVATVSVTTPSVSLSSSSSAFLSQQHRLLHGERLLCVPVVWSSEQWGELLPHGWLLLLELCPVVRQAIGAGGEGELLDGRHLGPLETGRAGHTSRGTRG